MVQVTIDPPSITAPNTAEHAVTVQGLAVGDIVVPVKPSHTVGYVVGGARVSAPNTLLLTLAAVVTANPGPEVWTIIWFRPEVGNPAVLPGAVQV